MIRRRGAIMATIQEHLSSAELEARYKAAGDAISKSHFHALWLLSSGYAIGEVAELLSFSTRWIRLLIHRYNEGGPEALGDRRAGNGASPKILTPAALAALKERIRTPPDDGGLWSGPKIARWLAQFHGLVSVHDQRGWDALIAIDYSLQQPRPRHPEAADEAEREALKKSLRRRAPTSKASARTPKSSSGRWMNIASA
jgi:transposase